MTHARPDALDGITVEQTGFGLFAGGSNVMFLQAAATSAAALTAAETGHLVLATLHTNDAVTTVNRIVDVFPGHQQAQIRYQFAQTLQGIINQRLLPKADKTGRVLAREVLIATEAARTMIRENKIHQLDRVIETGGALGMRGLEHGIEDLYQQGVITYDVLVSHCPAKNGRHKAAG